MNAIEVKNLSKIYTLQNETTGRISLRLLLSSLFQTVTKKSRKAPTQFLALDSLYFSVKKGETIGLIGPNGSGKSTLLRLLSGITSPTSGTIILNGSLTPLLSLGLGFHPDLTGRENIYLNAALLNYPKKKVEKQIKHIIAFSDLGRFIDTPVKYYSSGMYARLGFSISTAQSLEPDILLVDETLAVGDASFHKKSFGRLKELTKKKKMTIIFVSHDLEAIKELCSSCIWLEKGKLKMYGKTSDVIEQYTSNLS